MPDTASTTEKLEPLNPGERRFHLFYSEKQFDVQSRLVNRCKVGRCRAFYKRESDGKVIQVTEATFDVKPFSKFDDVVYLGIGTMDHNEYI